MAVRDQDALVPNLLAVELRDGVLGLLHVLHANAGSHVAIGLEEHRDVEDLDVLPKKMLKECPN